MFKRPIKQAAIPVMLLFFTLLSACGGGSSPTTTTAGKMGSVGIVLTDAPADPSHFSAIKASIERVELIGGNGGKFALFDGPVETVDLLRLRNESVPFTFHDEVPVGTYCKIRLTLSTPRGLELVLASDGSRHYPKLPGNGKLDLLSRECFTVAPGASITLQLDVDAGNSIHIVETGKSTTYNFRPVVFVDVINQNFRAKLVRLEGEIAWVNALEQSLLLCDALPTRQLNGRGCALIYLGTDSAAFDNLTLHGDAVSMDNLLLDSSLGQPAAVVGLMRTLVTAYEAPVVPLDELPGKGFCRIWEPGVDVASQPYLNDEVCDDAGLLLPVGTVLINDQGVVVLDHRPQIALNGLAVEMGAFSQAYGLATSDADQVGFDMTEKTVGPLAVTLQDPATFNGTRILSQQGELLDYSAIRSSSALKVDGVQPVLGDALKAAVVIVDMSMDGRVLVSGEIASLSSGGFTLIPDTDLAPCSASAELGVVLSADAAVTTVTITNTTAEISPGGSLEAGQMVSVTGSCGTDGLTAASVVIMDDQTG